MFCKTSIPRITATEIREAICRDHFSLAFQPKVHLPTGEVVGVEVLSRWRHSILGLVPPSAFIPIAEECGLTDVLTDWMLNTALRQWTVWKASGLELDIAVNISALSFDQLDFPDKLEALCMQQNVPSRHLIIELTESATLHSTRLMDGMTRLRLKGFKTSLDDYGTGYSSLIQLHTLPFNELKIDQSFIRDADSSRDARIIVKSIIDLAHNLEMHVTAEGVETLEVLELLIDLGCDQAQGYLLGKPMAGSNLVSWHEMRNPDHLKMTA